MRLVVTGGGTGGHVLAGVAIAEEWRAEAQRQNKNFEILFVGAQGGIEERLVPKSGFALRVLKIGALNQVGWTTKLRTLLLLPFSVLHSIQILLQFKPDSVIGVGGYASGPFLLGVTLLKWVGLLREVRTAILEQNSVPGLTNRWLAKMVKRVFVAFDVSASAFEKSKVLVSGNPVRAELVKLPASPQSPFTVFIFGGSQGAQGINTLILEAILVLKKRYPEAFANMRWIHQTGVRDLDRVKSGYQKLECNAVVEPFIYDMKSSYSQASIVVCRAGSSTLSELAMVGRAPILIPFPFAADNHQEKNARAFSDVGAADVLLQNSSSGEDLAQVLMKHFSQENQRHAIEQKIQTLSRPGAAKTIVKDLNLRI